MGNRIKGISKLIEKVEEEDLDLVVDCILNIRNRSQIKEIYKTINSKRDNKEQLTLVKEYIAKLRNKR